MRNIVTLLLASILLLTAPNLQAQGTPKMPVDPETKLITYKEVVTTPGKPADLFNRGIEWVNKQYKNPVDATKVRDQASGTIEIIHRFDITKVEQGTTLPAGTIDYSLKIEMKDGRYRYTITNFTLKTISRQPIEKWMNKNDQSYIPAWDIYLKQVDDFTKKLIDSLKAGMQPPIEKKPDTW
jgi:hypothetical protein